MNTKRLVVGFACSFWIFALIPVARGDFSDRASAGLDLARSADRTSFDLVISAAVSSGNWIAFAHAPVEPEAPASEFVLAPADPLAPIARESLDLFSPDAFWLTRSADSSRNYAWRSTAIRVGRPAFRNPGGLAWVLSGMLSIGVWQVGRGARHLHFNGAPDWVHTGGPGQVGHATAFDFDWSRMPLCRFEQPVDATGFLLFHRLRGKQSERHDARRFLTVASPRGPPSDF